MTNLNLVHCVTEYNRLQQNHFLHFSCFTTMSESATLVDFNETTKSCKIIQRKKKRYDTLGNNGLHTKLATKNITYTHTKAFMTSSTTNGSHYHQQKQCLNDGTRLGILTCSSWKNALIFTEDNKIQFQYATCGLFVFFFASITIRNTAFALSRKF